MHVEHRAEVEEIKDKPQNARAERQAEQNAEECHQQRFAVHIAAHFQVVVAEYFERSDFAPSFADVHVGQIVDDENAQQGGKDDDDGGDRSDRIADTLDDNARNDHAADIRHVV